ARRRGNLVCKGKIRFPRHDENSAIASMKVYGLPAQSCRPTTQPERSFLTQRNGYNWRAWKNILNAIAVAANVVAQTTVIPIQEQTVEIMVDVFLGPSKERAE